MKFMDELEYLDGGINDIFLSNIEFYYDYILECFY